VGGPIGTISLGGMRGLVRTAISGHPGGMDDGRHRNGRGWAWALVGVLALLVVVETVVLAVVATLVSLLIAIAIVLVVIVAGLFIVRDVRRHWVRRPDDSETWDELVS
jgi:Flp pilus assembly protein TadB